MIYALQHTAKATTVGELRKLLEGLSDDIRILDCMEVRYLVHTGMARINSEEALHQAQVTHISISEDFGDDDEDQADD